jgi:integrase
LARKRYQNGSLKLRGKREKKWYGRWLEDVVVDGKVKRIHRAEIIGTLTQYPTKRLAMRALQERVAHVNAPSYRPQHTATFREFTKKWEASVLSQHKKTTQDAMRSDVKRLNAAFGDIPLSNISPEMVQAFVSKMREKYAPKTVRNTVTTLKLVWKTARAWGYVQNDVCAGLVLPKRALVVRPCFSVEQIQRIIAAADEPFKTMYWVLAETGIRGGELCGLLVNDIDFDRNIIMVQRAAYQGRLDTPKSHVRSFAISPQLADHLRTFLKEHWRKNDAGLLFATRNGTPYDRRDIVDQHLHPLLEKLGIDRAGLHAFRHGNSTLMDQLGVPLRVRQDRLGHCDAALTIGTYTHAASEDHRAAAQKIGAILCPSLLKSQGQMAPMSL